ncbi:MAG TPA: M14 family zinc carboxypeptidase, partial [Luteimonas sp.]
AALGACSTLPEAARAPAAVAPAEAATATAHVQQRRDWHFAADGVAFSNRLESARLNDVQRLGSDHYVVTIAPEIVPINPSPWYGFTVSAETERPLRIEFRYRDGKARYWPKLSRDGEHWHAATPEQFAEGGQGTTLTVDAGPQPLHVFAQPPIGIEAFADWANVLVERGVARRSVIGASEQGRPLHMLALGNPDAREVLLVLGRQHPPETTGTQALMGFVDELAADSPLARDFRERTLVIVLPLLNPDGVVEGNWRGNINGQDLNRDWGPFTQSETRAARDLLERELDDDGRRLAFAIDFHSTWSDVFYTVEEAPSRRPGGVLRRWIDDMQQRYPGRIRESASPSGNSAVFKNWAFRQYQAPTVTYEVGDKTGSEQLHELATFAADSAMRILLNESRPDASTPVTGSQGAQ